VESNETGAENNSKYVIAQQLLLRFHRPPCIHDSVSFGNLPTSFCFFNFCTQTHNKCHANRDHT